MKYNPGEINLWSFGVGVKFFYQIHTLLGVDGPIDSAVSQPDSPQVNGYYTQHAGPLGHDHTTRDIMAYYGTVDGFFNWVTCFKYELQKSFHQVIVRLLIDVLPFLVRILLSDHLKFGDNCRNLEK